jgi:hypothetical protein
MNRENYLNEVEKRLNRIFTASKEGYKVSPVERHRLEGFMAAGVFMGLVTNAELAKVMNDIHVRLFGKTIQQRKAELPGSWQEEGIDYSFYDQPTFERKDGLNSIDS